MIPQHSPTTSYRDMRYHFLSLLNHTGETQKINALLSIPIESTLLHPQFSLFIEIKCAQLSKTS